MPKFQMSEAGLETANFPCSIALRRKDYYKIKDIARAEGRPLCPTDQAKSGAKAALQDAGERAEA